MKDNEIPHKGWGQINQTLISKRINTDANFLVRKYYMFRPDKDDVRSMLAEEFLKRWDAQCNNRHRQSASRILQLARYVRLEIDRKLAKVYAQEAKQVPFDEEVHHVED